MHRLLLASCILALVIGLCGCATVVPSGVNILVAISNPFAGNEVQVGGAATTLNATVTFDGLHKGVKWALTTANVSCSPGCGTLLPQGDPSFSAIYTPPTSAPLNQQATITAISRSDDRQQFSFTFTILPPASVLITNKFTSALSGSSPVEVDATVMNDPANAGLNWTLTAAGSNCSPACGTLASSAAPSFSAVYTPPATFPSGTNVNPTITATAVVNPSATDSFAFNILSSATLFKGNYSFLVRGYDGNALPMSIAGTIVADGTGNLTGGELDINDDGGVTPLPAPQTGVYAVQISPTGITQVLFEIKSFTFPGSTNDLKFRFFLSSDGTRGRIVELDGSGYINTGTIELQDASASSVRPAGSYAFGVDSDAPFAGRTVAAGQLILDSAGVSGGLIDLSVAAASAPTYVAQPLTPDLLTAPDSMGRGTLTITAQGESVQYAYYIVNASHFYLIEIDRGLVFGTVFAGNARIQNGLTADSLNGISVIQLTGFDEPGGTSTVQPVVLVGLLTVTGGNSFNLLFDINDLGNVLTQHGANGAVTFDPSTGRAALSAPDGFGSNFLNAAAWYLYDTGKGFLVEEDPSTPDGTPPDQAITNRAMSGTTLLQTGSPYLASSLSGNTIVSFGASSSPQVPNADLGINFVSSTTGQTSVGSYSATGDVTSVPSQGANVPNVQFTGAFRLINLTEGYGAIQLPVALFGDFISPTGTIAQANFYMISPNQFVSVNTTFGQLSGVMFVDPD